MFVLSSRQGRKPDRDTNFVIEAIHGDLRAIQTAGYRQRPVRRVLVMCRPEVVGLPFQVAGHLRCLVVEGPLLGIPVAVIEG
jgi:hypothetical protein